MRASTAVAGDGTRVATRRGRRGWTVRGQRRLAEAGDQAGAALELLTEPGGGIATDAR